MDRGRGNEVIICKLITSFLASYRTKPAGLSDADWLYGKFGEYPDLWPDEVERRAEAERVARGVSDYRASQDAMETARRAGASSARFLEDVIRRGCAAGGVAATGRYVAGVDAAIEHANRQMAEVVFVHAPDGTLDTTRVNMNPNLNGNIAEAHHAGSFNVDAAVKESSLHAEVPASHGRNSVDILVKDGARGDAIVGKYQSKYGADASATEQQFGNRYRGQRKLVPEEQANDIDGATDRLEESGVESSPLSKEEAVEMQREAQESGKAPEMDWNDANAGAVFKALGKKAAMAGLLAIGFQGARILGRRIWNSLSGQENASVSEDIEEFVDSAAKSGAGAVGVAAVAGGLTVAARKGLLGSAMKSVKGNFIANAVCAAVENVKILWKVGIGEVSGEEAIDLAGRANTALAGSLLLGGEGVTAGAAIGSVFGPVGTAVGGVIGGVVGGIAGSAVGEAVWEGAKVVCSKVAEVASGLAEGVATLCRGVGNLARSINPFCWF